MKTRVSILQESREYRNQLAESLVGVPEDELHRTFRSITDGFTLMVDHLEVAPVFRDRASFALRGIQYSGAAILSLEEAERDLAVPAHWVSAVSVHASDHVVVVSAGSLARVRSRM